MKQLISADTYKTFKSLSDKFLQYTNKCVALKLLALVLISFDGKAQTVEMPVDCHLSVDSMNTAMVIELPDSINISQIEVQIGTNTDSSDIFSYPFEFDLFSNLPNGYSYSRNNLIVILGLGDIELTNLMFSKVRLKNFNDVWSDWYEFISNK